MKKIYKERLDNGLCVECGSPNDRADVSTVCSACYQKRKVRRDQLNAERVANHLCLKCGKPTDGIHKYCDACNAKNRVHMRETREFLIEQGICIDCRREKAVKGKVRCLLCADSRNEHRKKYYATHKKEILSKTDNAKRREKHKEYKAKGICTRCHVKKATPGYTTCADCRIKDTKARKLRDAKKRDTVDYETCLEMHICTACRVNAATHGKLCDTCYERAVNNLGDKRTTANHFWMQDNTAMFTMNALKRM